MRAARLRARPRALLRAAFAVLVTAALTTPLVPGNAQAGGAADAREVGLRVASYNIHAGIGADGEFDLGRTAAAIRATGADVVGLQEVDVHWGSRSEWRDEARALAEKLDMRVFFAPIYQLDPPEADRPPREFGLAVLSRHPIVHAENHQITRLSTQLPSPEPAPAPGFPEVVINVRGALVHVYGTHLDYRGDPTVREMQVADMLAIMREDAGAQQVLLGDFNAPPGAPELAPVWDHVEDAWLAADSDAGAGQTFPATDPATRIDYITVSPGIGVRAARVPDTPASDHLPVVADLTVSRGA